MPEKPTLGVPSPPPGPLTRRIGEAAHPSASLTIRPEFTREQAEALDRFLAVYLDSAAHWVLGERTHALVLGSHGVLRAHLRGEI